MKLNATVRQLCTFLFFSSFIVSSYGQAPNQPANPVPASQAGSISINPDLCATVSDPNGGTLQVRYHGRKVPANGSEKFTIILLPDTQYYTEEPQGNHQGGIAAMFNAQTAWIANNRQSMNIVYVGQLGDCTQNGDNPPGTNDDIEWERANTAISTIESPSLTGLPQGIPYGISVGNHDQSPGGGGNTAATNKYNQYFGISRFTGRNYYGGHEGSNNDNHYQLFSASGIDFLVISMEYDTTPETAVLDWAANLVQTYSNRKVMVMTHFGINETGSPKPTFGAQGQAIYDKLKQYPNFMLFVCGHIHQSDGEARRSDIYNGNTVHTVLSDYQERQGGGNGLLRIMEFDPSQNKISVKTYSPYTNTYETDTDSQFELSFNMLPVIGQVNSVTSGTNGCFPWSNLDFSTNYEWDMELYDGQNVTLGPVWKFATAGTDVTPPTVTSVAPVNGATGVSVSTTASAIFSEAMNATTINSSTIELRNPSNTLVAATVSYNATTRTATLTPSATLANSTVYTAKVISGTSGVKDAAGNALASDYSWSFTTVAGDITPPTVTSVSPVNGATGVSVSTTASAIFSEAMNATTINSSTIELRNPSNTLITATVSYNATTRTATLTPSAALANSTVYTAKVISGTSGVKDAAGNALASDYSWSFTTVAADITPPTVTSVTPVNGATGVSVSTTVSAIFSEAMNATTINSSTIELRNPSNTLVAAVVAYNTTTRTATLTPSAALANSTVYTAKVISGSAGVKDAAGNALASDYSWSFTTVAVTSQLPVTIQSTNPKTGTAATAHSLTGVPAAALLVLATTCDAAVSNCSVSSSPSLTWTKRADAGATSSDNAEIWTAVYSAGGSITVTSNWGGDNSQSSVCYVVLNAEATLGGASAIATLQSAPSVTITTTRDNSIIFGCTADWKAVNGTTRTIRDAATERLYFKDGNFTTYHYTKATASIAAYTEGVSLPTDQQASTALLEIRSATVTADIIPPTVTSVTPVNGATGISISTTASAIFSEVMNATTINSSTIELRNPSNTLIAAVVAYNATTRTATLTPSAALANLTVYTAKVISGTSGVKDAAGNALASDYSWSFTTVAGDITPPTVTSVSPVNGATGVSVSTTASAIFSEAMNATTINSSTIELRNPSNTLIAAVVAYNATTRTATLTPSATLANSTVYTAKVISGPAGVKDAADNPLASDYSWSFTTVAADIIPPTVTSVTPVNGATGISISTTASAIFSEAMNATTINSSTIELRNPSNTLIAAVVSYNATTRTATLTPSVALANSTVYTAKVISGPAGVKDAAGNPLASDYSWSFTTVAADIIPPTVTSVTPVNGATGISISTTASAIFSEAMNATTINSSTIELRNPFNTLIGAVVAYNATTRTATLTPSVALANSTVYTANVISGPAGVKDAAGNPLASDYSWSFTTVAVTSQLPVTIQSTNPKTGTAATVHSLAGVPAGALLVLATTADAVVSNCSVSSSPSLTWTKRADAGATSSDNAEIWTAVYAAGGSITVTSNWGGDNSQASVCYVVLNAEPVLGGASAIATLQSAPSVTITTTRDNSIIFGCTADWKAVNGATRTLRDAATERLYFKDGNFTTYHYTKAATSIAAYTEGVSIPTGQQSSTSLLEIRGAATVATRPVNPVVTTTNPTIYSNSLGQNYPNPFEHGTNIPFTLARAEKVNLVLFDINGRVVKVLVNASKDKGTHAVNFNAGSLAKGIYYYSIQAGNFTEVKKLIIW